MSTNPQQAAGGPSPVAPPAGTILPPGVLPSGCPAQALPGNAVRYAGSPIIHRPVYYDAGAAHFRPPAAMYDPSRLPRPMLLRPGEAVYPQGYVVCPPQAVLPYPGAAPPPYQVAPAPFVYQQPQPPPPHGVVVSGAPVRAPEPQRVVYHPPTGLQQQQPVVATSSISTDSSSSKPLEMITEITQELRRASVEVSDASEDLSEAEELSRSDRKVSTDSDVVHLEEGGEEEAAAKESIQTTGDDRNVKLNEPEVIVKVPWSWLRTVENSSVIYASPSGDRLSNMEDLKSYLLREGTCKCGLECPLDINTFFNFDPKVKSVQAPLDVVTRPDPARYCSRRGRAHEMASYEEMSGIKIHHMKPPPRAKRKKKLYANLVMTKQMLEAREAEKKRIIEIIEEEKRREHEAGLASETTPSTSSGKQLALPPKAKNKATPGTPVKNSKFRASTSHKLVSQQLPNLKGGVPTNDQQEEKKVAQAASAATGGPTVDSKNLEIRRMSATDEGDKVLQSAWDSPEKEKTGCTPLEMVASIVSSMPPPKKEDAEVENTPPINDAPPVLESSSGSKPVQPQPVPVNSKPSNNASNVVVTTSAPGVISSAQKVEPAAGPAPAVAAFPPQPQPPPPPMMHLVNTVNGPMLVPVNNAHPPPVLISSGPQGPPPPPMAYHPQAPIMATGMPGNHGPPPLLLPGAPAPPSMLPTFQQLPDGSLIPIGQAPPPSMPAAAGAPALVNYVMTPQGLVPAAAAAAAASSFPRYTAPVQPTAVSAAGGRVEEVIELADSDTSDEEEEKPELPEPNQESAVEYGDPAGRKKNKGRTKSEKQQSVQSNKVDSSGLKATPPHSGPDENQVCNRSAGGEETYEEEPSSSSLIPMGRRARSELSLAGRKRKSRSPTQNVSKSGGSKEETPLDEGEGDIDDNCSETSSSSSAILNAGAGSSDEDTMTTPATTPSKTTFHLGEVVWGPHGTFPSWPGKVVTPSPCPGAKAVICWFGNKDVTAVDSADLKSLSEGLEEHHKQRQKLRKGRKMNASLEKAIQEAMAELD